MMMRTFLALAALLIAAGPTYAADTAAAVQKTLQASYDARDKAVARHDLEAVLAQYAPGFVGVSRTGKIHGLKEERADFAQTFALPVQADVTQSTIEKLTLAKAGVEAAVTLRRQGTLHLADPQTRADRTVILDGVYADVWAKRAGVWRLTREQEVSVHAALAAQTTEPPKSSP